MSITVSQTKRGAKLLYRWCLIDGRLDEFRARQAVKHVSESKRRGYLGVIGEFRRLVKLDRGRHTAMVESAVRLQSDLQVHLRKTLAKAYGEDLITEFAKSPELIGGIRIRVASDLYDGSVKSKLLTLARSFGIANEETAVR